MTAMRLTCDLRLGDIATAEIDGVEVVGTVVHVGPLFATLMGTGYRGFGRRIEPDPDGAVMVGKHSELKSIAAPGHPDELVDWLDRPVILCETCRP